MKQIFLTLAFLPFCATIGAQDTLKMNLDQAIEMAMSESRTIKIAEKEIERVDYSKSAAWYGLMPTLSASGQAMKYAMPAKVVQFGSLMNSPADYNVSLSLDLSLPLIVPALWQSIKMTELDMRLALESARASKLTLRNEVSKAFYNALLAQDSYQTLQDGYEVAKQNYENAKKRFEVGAAAEFDLVSSEVQMRNLTPNLLQMENGVKQSKMYLKVLIGLAANINLEVEGNLTDFENELKLFSQNQEVALAENTDLIQMELQKQKLTKALQIQRSQRIPTLVGFGKYGYTGSDMNAVTMKMEMGGQEIPVNMPSSHEFYFDGLILGVQLNVPIFSGMTNVVKEKQLKIQSQQLDMQYEYLESNLNVQAVAALDDMQKSIEQVESNKDNIRLAQKGYDISLKRYETGMGTMLEVQNASNQLMQAKLSYNQAIASYLNAKADLEKLLGKEG